MKDEIKPNKTETKPSKTGITLDESQTAAVEAIYSWYDAIENRTPGYKRTFVLAGLAGTGKSTIVKYIIDNLDIPGDVAFCAFTGKAALVLTRKGTPATTIHKLMYDVNEDKKTGKIYFTRKPKLDPEIALIVVDEASMVSPEIQADLESYGRPILYVGDHGQLPPVGTQTSLMAKPDIRLTKIHRQAEENPIIHLSKLVRLGAKLPYKEFGPGVRKVSKNDITPMDLFKFDQILCGKNQTRQMINSKIRTLLERDTMMPVEGDRIICLKNNYKLGLINGMQGIVLSEQEFDYSELADNQKDFPTDARAVTFKTDESDELDHFENIPYQDYVFRHNLAPDMKDKYLCPIDYSYAITVHKSQGSQYDRVAIFEEYLGDYNFHAKWMYTAVTRAISEVTIISK